jgi:predicted metalloprotease with PDZ domain
MNDTPVVYRIEPFDPSGHRYRVSVTVTRPDPDGQLFSLPSWIPGSYLIRDFSRQIEMAAASAAGRDVALSKIDAHTWRAQPVEKPLTVDYVVYAWDLSVRGAHVDESHGFFNGASVFLAVIGQESNPCLLDIVPPAHTDRWKVYTSLSEARGLKGAARRHGFGLYRAPDYDALLDHPVEMGTPQTARFTAHGAEHELVFTGLAPGLDLARIATDARRICEAQIAFFEPHTRRAPFLDSAERYVFMTMITGDGYGGLEHRASTALMTARKDLPIKGHEAQSDGYRGFLGLLSHEYFHTWNVKRIKPQAFVPYDLTQPNPTRLLWVFEGFTSYYDDLFLLRSETVNQTQYFALLAKTITSVMRTPGRRKQSVAESSFDTWTRYYKQDENSPNALVSYYTKGALVALGLDLTIREETNGTRSLDDVMRLLWTRYGRDFYRGRAAGIAEDALPDLILEATGVDTRRFIRRYAYGRADVPLLDLLERAGVHTRWVATQALPTLDIRVRKDGRALMIATALEEGAAHKGGLSAGDQLVAIDGIRVDAQVGLDPLLARYHAGAAVDVHVFRRDELRRYRVRLAAPSTFDCVLSVADTAVNPITA